MLDRPALSKLLAWWFGSLIALALGGCSTAGLLVTAAGVATDTSITWEIVKHAHAKLTEGDPTPCIRLGSVERALSVRCDYEPGRIAPEDVSKARLQECPLTTAARDARLWRALPELLDRGAALEACTESPLAALARAEACPPFDAASPAVRQAIVFLGEADPRAIRHDVFRMLGCPAARTAGIDRVLSGWLAHGDLEPRTLSFSALSALHPDLIGSDFAQALEAAGHTAAAALDAYAGTATSGFEEALATSHLAALTWWLDRLPQLADFVAPTRSGALGFIPLQRVLTPGFLKRPEAQRDTVALLLARGADPKRRLPFDSALTVAGYAAAMKSPAQDLLTAPAPAAALNVASLARR